MDWTTAVDIKQQLLRYWNSGRLLKARVQDQPLFPMDMRFRGPDSAALSERFEEVRTWIRDLEAGSRAQQGFGYEIKWRDINHRRLGQNRVPCAIVMPMEADALQLIDKSSQAEQFVAIVQESLSHFPVLREWFALRPLAALEHASDWPRILAVLNWFSAHPSSGLYLRQLDIPAVDTKFIESRQGLFSELLDKIVEPTSARSFEPRYGLLSKPSLIRFRILDRRLAIGGLNDLTVPVAQFARLHLPAERVFITENEINGLVFPEAPGSIVIFGLGYGVQMLREIPWLQQKELWYWGDIDTHGFAILDRLRASFPMVRSFLMDRETLLVHRELWGRESEIFEGVISRLSEAERALLDDLRDEKLGYRIRLEQELISFGWFKRTLRSLGFQVRDGADLAV